MTTPLAPNDRRLDRIANLWAAGHDSFAIGKALDLHEADVCRVLARQRADRLDRLNRKLGGLNGTR